jgi:peroxiredoxin
VVIIAVEVGQKAPDFTLKNQNEGDISLSNFKEKNIILAFYPFDFSPTCTDEMSCFQLDLGKLKDANTDVLAVSVDSHWSHKAFADKLNLNYNLLSDFTKEASKKYGVLRKEGFSDRAYFIIDKNRIVRFKKIMDNPGTRLENQDLLNQIRKIN